MPNSNLVQLEAQGEVDDAFPEPLRDPVLRKVQFSQIARIDHLGKLSVMPRELAHG